MSELVLVVQENYGGTFTVAEPVDSSFWGVDFIEVCTADTVEEVKAVARAKYPDYKVSFQFN